MPADLASVNLLDRDQFTESPIGRVVNWAVSYGRYIMITTEIVVLLAFISRFSLDRKLTDINGSITQKQTIIESNKSFEEEFIYYQNQISKIKTLIASQNHDTELLNLIKSILPPGVYLESFRYNKTQLQVQVVAPDTQMFAIFMNNIQITRQFIKIELGDIKKDPLKGITFLATIILKDNTQEKNLSLDKSN